MAAGQDERQRGPDRTTHPYNPMVPREVNGRELGIMRQPAGRWVRVRDDHSRGWRGPILEPGQLALSSSRG